MVRISFPDTQFPFVYVVARNHVSDKRDDSYAKEIWDP